MPLNEMPLSSGSTSLSMTVACRYGRWAAHFAWRYSSSGVTRLVRALDKGCTTRRGVRAVRWQAHDHSRGLFTVTLPYTVRSTVERLSLWLKAAPQRRQWVWLESHHSTCFETSSACTLASSDRPSARVRPSWARLQSRRSTTARTPSPSLTVSLSPSDNLASMINRMVCSHRCDTDQRTPHEAGAAPRCSSGPPWEPPQLLHALWSGSSSASLR